MVVSHVLTCLSKDFDGVSHGYHLILSCWVAQGRNGGRLDLRNKPYRHSPALFDCLSCLIFSTSCLLFVSSPTTRKNLLRCVLSKGLYSLKWWHNTSTFSRLFAYTTCQVINAEIDLIDTAQIILFNFFWLILHHLVQREPECRVKYQFYCLLPANCWQYFLKII